MLLVHNLQPSTHRGLATIHGLFKGIYSGLVFLADIYKSAFMRLARYRRIKSKRGSI